MPPPPYTLSEFDPDGVLPERVYDKSELITYIKFCREKCRKMISELSDENLKKRFINEYRDYSRLEILLYNMRHVQHHAGQLNCDSPERDRTAGLGVADKLLITNYKLQITNY